MLLLHAHSRSGVRQPCTRRWPGGRSTAGTCMATRCSAAAHACACWRSPGPAHLQALASPLCLPPGRLSSLQLPLGCLALLAGLGDALVAGGLESRLASADLLACSSSTHGSVMAAEGSRLRRLNAPQVSSSPMQDWTVAGAAARRPHTCTRAHSPKHAAGAAGPTPRPPPRPASLQLRRPAPLVPAAPTQQAWHDLRGPGLHPALAARLLRQQATERG